MSKAMASTMVTPRKSPCLATINSTLSQRQASDPDPTRLLIISRVRHNRISVNPKLFMVGSTVCGGRRAVQNIFNRRKMEFAVCSTKKPESPLPVSWKLWTLGTVMTIILSFSTAQLEPLLDVEEKVETAARAAEHVTKIVEGVASKVEEVVEDAANQVPVGTRDAAVFFENVAKEIEKDTHILEQALKKAEEVEKKVESFFQSLTQQENTVMTTETQGQK